MIRPAAARQRADETTHKHCWSRAKHLNSLQCYIISKHWLFSLCLHQ